MVSIVALFAYRLQSQNSRSGEVGWELGPETPETKIANL